MKPDLKKGTGPFADIVVFNTMDQNPFITICKTCGVNKVKFSVQTSKIEDNKFKCEIFINDHLLSTAVDTNRKTSKMSAATLGVEKLTESCYTVEIKSNFNSGGTVITRETKLKQNTNLDLPADNIGTRIMRLMGWSGNQGLGKDNQGIEKPIETRRIINRAGFGLSRGFDLRKKFTETFREFAKGDSEYDLVFSAEFTAEERASLHMLARKFKLRTKSFGQGAERHLVVSKAQLNVGDVWKIVEELLATSNWETEKYRLIEPSCLIK